jgi:integrase
MQKKADVKLGKEPDLKRIVNHMFKELADDSLVWAARQRSFPSKKIWVDQLTEKFGDTPLRQFSSRLIEQFQTERLQEGRKRKVVKKDKYGRRVPTVLEGTPRGNKPATVNRFLATMKHMFTKAVEWEMVEEEILKKVHKVKFLPENNRRLRYLSKEECQTLIDSCNPYLKSIVITALNTGMRRGEILKQTWDRVDLRHGFILLETTKNGERREIPINATVRKTLQNSEKVGCTVCVPRQWHALRRCEERIQASVQEGGLNRFPFPRPQTHLCFATRYGRS